ncbi:MAG: twin-arginine translocase TatA/TatE family subunit [Bacteroidales bacterium]|nr:twin-arginine translocase TatA/TatE family subunit [Bacteroidales bacterium]
MILLFLNISGGEILVLLLVMLLVFGPKQSMEFIRKIGRVMNEFKKAANSVKDEIMKEEKEVKSDKKETEQTTTI